MAVEHKEYPVYGVQFHPESVMTPDGRKMIENFLSVFEKGFARCAQFVGDSPDEGVVAGYGNRFGKISRKVGRADCGNDFSDALEAQVRFDNL